MSDSCRRYALAGCPVVWRPDLGTAAESSLLQEGVCEIDPETPCAWQLIYEKLAAQDRLHLIMEIQPPKDWSTSRDGGPRKITREDLRLVAEETE